MQQEESELQFDFPYNQLEYPKNIVRLADFDVVGVSGPRLRRLIRLNKDHQFILYTHEHWVSVPFKDEYKKSLAQFLKLFKSSEVVASEGKYSDEFLHRINKDFIQSFKLIGDHSEKLLNDFETGYNKGNWILEDHFSWWPLYLKEKFSQKDISEVAIYEWSVAKLDYIDLPIYRTVDPGQIYLNPSIQLVKMDSAAKVLSKHPGIWIVYRQADESQVLETRLDVKTAQILDVMAEERKFTVGQLTDWMQQETEFKDDSPTAILLFIENLIRDSILIQRKDAF